MILNGKRIAFLGDSITEGSGVQDVASNRYDNILKRECGLAATYNYGIGGTRLAHQSAPSEKPRFDLCFCGRAYNIDPSADVILTYGGVNDYIHGDAPIGTPDDRTPATFHGAVWFLMDLLKTLYPQSTPVFLTPAHCNVRGEQSDRLPSNRPCKKADALPLEGYVEIIKSTAKEFGIPALDLYNELGIDPCARQEDYERYTADGLHLNDAGHRILAERVKSFLEAL